MSRSIVPRFYQSVIDDVITHVHEAFIDEGYDEQILTELKQVWEKKLVESKAIERDPEPVITRPMPQSLPPQPVQQQSTHVASTAAIPHQITVPAGNLVSPTVLQYTPQNNAGDGQKPAMSLNLPPKLTLTVPAHLAQAGLQTLVAGSLGNSSFDVQVPRTTILQRDALRSSFKSTGPAGTTVQLPPELAQLFQNNVLHAATQSNPAQHGSQQIPGVQYQLTAEQLQKAQQFTVAIPVTASQNQTPGILQLDGTNDTSDDDDDDEFQDNDDDRDDNDEDQNEDDVGEEDEEPLNSADDVSDEDPADLFDTDNVVVCQYDKITRSKNRWKFHLKDGIMNLKGKDYVFQKALGDSEW